MGLCQYGMVGRWLMKSDRKPSEECKLEYTFDCEETTQYRVSYHGCLPFTCTQGNRLVQFEQKISKNPEREFRIDEIWRVPFASFFSRGAWNCMHEIKAKGKRSHFPFDFRLGNLEYLSRRSVFFGNRLTIYIPTEIFPDFFWVNGKQPA